MRKILSILSASALLITLHVNEVHGQACPNMVNLVDNPDFALGNAGFTPGLPLATGLCNAGEYIIGNNFNLKCNMGPWAIAGGGAGNFMIVDGPPAGGAVLVWSQQVDVCPNTVYTFSYRANNLYGGTFPLQFVAHTTTVTPVAMAAGWNLYTTTWNSGPTPPPTITIGLRIPTAGGQRDFGVDDIFFGYCDNLTVSAPTTICSGACATLTATGAVSYSWSNGATTASTTVCPGSTTTYTVSGTDAGGCLMFGPLTTTVNVNPSPTVTATAAPSTLTPPSITTSYLTAPVSGGSGFTYSWAPATGLSSTTIANPVATPTATTVYTVTVTNSGGCTSTTTVQVTVNPQPMCTLTYDHDIPTGENVTTAFPSMTGVTAQNIHITGVFTVNTSFNFSGCNIVMEPNSRIEVLSGAVLYITANTHIYTCDGMWDGINLQNGSSAQIMNASIIEDAMAAVTINQGSTARIDRCIFNRNYTAVDVTANTSTTSPLDMTTCVVSCLDLGLNVNPMLNPLSPTVWANIVTGGVYTNINMKFPFHSYRSIYGVRATDVNMLQVGNAASSSIFNGFNNLMAVGVYAVRSNVVVYNNRFRSFTNAMTCFSCTPLSGVAVLGQGTSAATYAMKVGGTAANQANDFYNVKFAVEMDQYTTNLVLENTITNTSTSTALFGGYGKLGVKINAAANSTINVSGNTITNAATAVIVTRNNTSASQTVSLTIDDNDIVANSTGFCTTGISLTDVTGVVLTPGAHEINFNRIVEAATCITLTNVTIKNNVYYNSCMTRYAASGNINGIKLSNCQNQNVQQNHTKYNTSGTNVLAYGISLINSPANRVACNTVEGATRSLVFSGNCAAPHNIVQNTMRNAQAGMVLLTSSTDIGQQGISVSASDNYWDMSSTMTTQIINNSSITLVLYVSPPTTGMATQPLSITGPASINVISGFSPAACGAVPARLSGEEASTQVEQTGPSPLVVFPNPNNGQFTIAASSGEVKDVMVYDMNGRLVFSVMQTTDTNIAVDISNEAKGLYVVKVITGDDVQSARISNQ